jgi:type VI secretion system protein ImpH
MATASGLESAAVAQPGLDRLLREEATSVGFFQAVRLLERLLPDRDPVGGFGDPAREIVRFGANPSVAFPPGEIAALEQDDDGGQPRMTVNFMGLNGPQGVLPLVYSVQVADRARVKDTALRDFLDLFNHRIISLFYRAWEKSRLDVAREHERQNRITGHLLDLIGLGSAGLQNRLALDDEALIFYSGLLALRPRSATALQQMIEDYFGVNAEVEQFVGGWYALDEGTQCRLGDETGECGQLGIGSVAGDEIWDQQSRVRLRLGPMSRSQYDRFLPTGDAHAPLRELTRFFSGDQLDFEVQLVLAQDDVPGCMLGADDAEAPPLGWSTWLRSAPFTRDADDTILSLHPDAGKRQ